MLISGCWACVTDGWEACGGDFLGVGFVGLNWSCMKMKCYNRVRIVKRIGCYTWHGRFCTLLPFQTTFRSYLKSYTKFAAALAHGKQNMLVHVQSFKFFIIPSIQDHGVGGAKLSTARLSLFQMQLSRYSITNTRNSLFSDLLFPQEP
jgi:hypothetical protein